MFIFLKAAFTIIFLLYFGILDLKKREVENKPILLFYLLSVSIFVFEYHYFDLSFFDIVIRMTMIVIVLILYQGGLFAGADCKILIAIALLYSFWLLYPLLIAFFYAVIYAIFSRNKFLKRYLNVENGIPFLFCVCCAFPFGFLI
jgi:Flp pilus assembly protein protease CpaA